MADTTQTAARILTMIPLIRSQPGIKIEELARILRCPAKTVLADLDAILMCGVPPYLPNDYVGVCVEDGGVRLDFADHFRRPVSLTLPEVLSLRLALDAVPVAGEAGRSLRRKIAPLAPAGRWGMGAPGFHVAAGGDAVQGRLQRLRDAVAGNREVRMTYYTASRDELTERTIRPYGLVELRGEWYVVGHCLLRDRELPFRVDRIRAMTVLDARFTVPPDFDIETYRRDEMYFPSARDIVVTIRVDADLAARVRDEVAFPESQVQPNGDVHCTVRVSHPEWLLAWAVQYGAGVEILSPPDLRSRMRSLCTRLRATYTT